MNLNNRKFAITGAGRGLGAALAKCLVPMGATPLLLGRTPGDLIQTSEWIKNNHDHEPDQIPCDLTNFESCRRAAQIILDNHPDLDGLIHNGAMWLPGSLTENTDQQIQECITSATTGSLILTKHLLPVLEQKHHSDIHMVVSTSGIPNRPLMGTSIAFKAAKAAQNAMIQGLSEELKDTSIRVTAIYPCDFEDIQPETDEWNNVRTAKDSLTNREIVEAIIYTLTRPANARISKMVIEK